MFWRKKEKKHIEGQQANGLMLSLQDGSLQNVPIEHILKAHEELSQKLRAEIDITRDRIAYFYDHLIERLANICHSLPATQHGQYRQAAGLMGQCLRTAFIAQRIANGRVVSSEYPADARAQLERSWRYVAMLTGLVYPTGVLAHLGAKGLKSNSIWRIESGGLAEWLEEQGEEGYQPYWNPRPSKMLDEQMIRIWVLSKLMDREMYQYITSESDEFLNQMMSVLTEQSDEEIDMLADVINKAITKSKLQEINCKVTQISGIQGSHEERLKDAISIVLNEDRGKLETPVRRDGDAIYCLWPKMADRLRATASKYNLVGISDDPEELIRTMLEAEIIEINEEGGWEHQIQPEEKGMVMTVPAIKLNLPASKDHLDNYPHIRNDHQQEEEEVLQDPEMETGSPKKIKHNGDLPRDKQEGVVETIPEPTIGGEPVSGFNPGQGSASTKHESMEKLGSFATYLKRTGVEIDKLGWWSERGRALPWPELAEMADSKPQDVLKTLAEAGIAVKSDNKFLPLVHDLMVEGKRVSAIIISKEHWPGEKA